MREADIPVKTEEGRREITERRHPLSVRQRSLLIAIHGEHPLLELRRQFRGLGDVDALIDQLCAAGLVQAKADLTATASPVQAFAPAADPCLSPLRLARKFMSDTAVSTLGLRSFLFTLKLEKCYSKSDLDALLPEYRRVMLKAKNTAFAEAMVRRAEAMMMQV